VAGKKGHSGRRKAASLGDWTWQEVHLFRWYFVRYAVHDGKRIVDETAFDYAAEAVKATPARGGTAAMRRSYVWVQKRPHLIGHGRMPFFERHYASRRLRLLSALLE
jgi:hypothetical protein